MMPRSSPTERVEPDRESPGNTAATHWVRPMTMASAVWSFFRPGFCTRLPCRSWMVFLWVRRSARMPRNSRALVARRARPSASMLESEPSWSDRSLSCMPVPGMGANSRNRGKSPMMSMKISRRSWFISLHLNLPWTTSTHREPNSLRSRQMSFRYTNTTATRVPRWSMMSNRMPGSSMPNRCLEMDRCPLLETGRNSVAPWMIPWMMASKTVISSSYVAAEPPGGSFGPLSRLRRSVAFFLLLADHAGQAVHGVGQGAQRVDEPLLHRVGAV